jgi:putative transposase
MASRALLREKTSEKMGEPSSVGVVSTTSTLHRASAKLSDEQWARLKPLLPKNGRRGGQWREHRTVVEAILWVLVNGASWRDLPKEFGPWQTAYQRYMRWQYEGLWQRVVELLQC